MFYICKGFITREYSHLFHSLVPGPKTRSSATAEGPRGHVTLDTCLLYRPITHALVLICINQYTRFEVHSFTNYEYMIESKISKRIT